MCAGEKEIRVRDVGAVRWWKEGVVVAHARVDGITSRRSRSVIIVTPLRCVIVDGSGKRRRWRRLQPDSANRLSTAAASSPRAEASRRQRARNRAWDPCPSLAERFALDTHRRARLVRVSAVAEPRLH